MTTSPESLCNTSVEDAKSSLYHFGVGDLKIVQKAYLYECAHMNRSSMKKILLAKQRQLLKEKKQ